MSVYLPTKRHTTYVYDFWWKGQHYKDTTDQTVKADAQLVEAKLKLKLRAEAGGLVPAPAVVTPTFTAWAGPTLRYQAKFIKRPGTLEKSLRMILAFWGAKPATAIGPAAVARHERAPRPYHNLRLDDPIRDPTWLEAFEQWMLARGVSGSTRNSYLSACSALYTCALQPQFRPTTCVSVNPFDGIRRSPPRTRTVALTPEQVLALVAAVGVRGRHIAHALCIAALAPKLRLATILRLEWAVHLDPALTTMTIGDHKTSGSSGAQTVHVTELLRQILTDIRAQQQPASPYVITWKGLPVATLKTGLRRAVERIGLTWGLQDGVTFHVMRHSMATILANPALVGPLTERLRADVMGHKELRTTQKYTHLNPVIQHAPHEALAAALPGLRAAVPVRGKVGGPAPGKVGGPRRPLAPKPEHNRVVRFTGDPADPTRKRRIS